jgi:hypothetical protein
MMDKQHCLLNVRYLVKQRLIDEILQEAAHTVHHQPELLIVREGVSVPKAVLYNAAKRVIERYNPEKGKGKEVAGK